MQEVTVRIVSNGYIVSAFGYDNQILVEVANPLTPAGVSWHIVEVLREHGNAVAKLPDGADVMDLDMPDADVLDAETDE